MLGFLLTSRSHKYYKSSKLFVHVLIKVILEKKKKKLYTLLYIFKLSFGFFIATFSSYKKCNFWKFELFWLTNHRSRLCQIRGLQIRKTIESESEKRPCVCSLNAIWKQCPVIRQTGRRRKTGFLSVTPREGGKALSAQEFGREAEAET